MYKVFGQVKVLIFISETVKDNVITVSFDNLFVYFMDRTKNELYTRVGLKTEPCRGEIQIRFEYF